MVILSLPYLSTATISKVDMGLLYFDLKLSLARDGSLAKFPH